MRFANVRELKNKTSEILRLAARETVVITSRGKPRAIIKGVTESTFEDQISAAGGVRAPRGMRVAEADPGQFGESVGGRWDGADSEQGTSKVRLKAVFWDYPELANAREFEKFLERRREMNDDWALEWILTRFLEHGRAVDAMKYFRLDEIRAMLPKLRLSPYAKKKWIRILEVYGHD